MENANGIPDRRRQSRSSIYRYLYNAKDFCSRQSLARELNLSLPTVYQNLSELMEEGLVRDSGEQQSTGGRKASGLSIVPEARIAVGVSITEAHLRFVAADLQLQELAYQKAVIPPETAFPDLGGFLAPALEQFLDDNRIERSRMLGVGIALPGIITPDGSGIFSAPTLDLKNTSLQSLTQSIPYPVYVENDGTSGGYAEWFKHSGKQNMAYLSLENGVGGAILFNGAPYIGDNRRSGEFGHMCVEPGGLLCKCGRQGCLEAYCSARRISDDLGITLKEFFDGVDHHVLEYELLWYDFLRHLATGINSIRMMLDCDVVLGGFLTEYISPYISQLKSYAAAANTFETNADYLRLSALRKHTVPLGVALHFVVQFLDQI